MTIIVPRNKWPRLEESQPAKYSSTLAVSNESAHKKGNSFLLQDVDIYRPSLMQTFLNLVLS